MKKTSLYWGLFSSIILCLSSFSIACGQFNPKANPDAEVKFGYARFTVLTPRLIRMEWNKSADFKDRASLVFINRKLPVPDFSVSRRNHHLMIDTGALKLTYKEDSGKFNANNLQIRFKVSNQWKTWHPGLTDSANLKGTIRTLDRAKGAVKLPNGLLSRSGWHIVDDSGRPLLNDSNWPWVQARKQQGQDWYFLGYGHDYKQQLKAYTRVAGKIPIPPRFAFGLWWSHWWAYTDQELIDLVHQFQNHDIPLNVLVVDMDWHKTWGRKGKDQSGQPKGWTGYTWNPDYFPNPQKFLNWTKREDLKVTLNLHPASGIQPYEAPYKKMANAMGVDPASEKYIPFNITDKKFAKNYFKYVIEPKEMQGIDFWWLDWQQWNKTKIPGVTPTWWLNYVFFTHSQREKKQRPLIYHRWGGLGNHRYEIGFSGDVVSVWPSLDFQPYFTATASNVGYGYWSHDMGGFYPATDSPELYTRWLQWGIFSPIVRTHFTKNAAARRRIWTYPYPYAQVMRKTLLMRYKLIPYIYTAARQAFESGVSIMRPMYYHWPEQDKAYSFKNEYMFGDDLLVNPVTRPMSKDESETTPHSLASKKIWLPKGQWVEWPTGASLKGDTVLSRHYSISQIPVFARRGSIIPMQTSVDFKQHQNHSIDPLVLTVFTGDSGSTRLYEDAGNTDGYKKDKYAWTTIEHTEPDKHTLKIRISPAQGSFSGMRSKRSYVIRLLNTWPAASMTLNGDKISYDETKTQKGGWSYDGNDFATVIRTSTLSVTKAVTVTVHFKEAIHSSLLDGMRGNIERLKTIREYVNALTNNSKKPAELVRLYQTGNRIGLYPDSAKAELEKFHQNIGSLYTKLNRLELDAKDLEAIRKLFKTITVK